MERTERRREDRARDIRAARAAARLKQGEVAELAGIHQATVAKAEAGRARADTYDLIEAALGMTP